MPGFEGFNTTPPEERTEETTEQISTEQATTEETTVVEKPVEETTTEETQATSTESTESTETTTEENTSQETPDTFIEDFNKRYNAEIKSDDEVKELFTLKGKVSEYETKLAGHDELKLSVDKHKEELEEVKKNGLSDLLEKPLIRQAYIAQQLINKYPDRDPDILGELAMSDIEKMPDIDVLARERKMRGSKSSLENIKAVIVKELGIDPEQKPEEWDSLVTTELELKATDARDRIKTLLKDIEIPKPVSKEERELQATKALEEKVKSVQPIRDIFNKFDTYKNGDFEFEPPEEFKSKLDDIFKGMFIDGGLTVNEENIATAELIKKALFVEEYLPKMMEVKEKEVIARLKAEEDARLNNDTPPNTATATDQGEPENPDQPGLSSFFGK